MVARILLVISFIILISCTDNKSSQDQVLKNIHKESFADLNLLKFTYLTGIENGQKVRTKFLTLEVINNHNKSIYFGDSIVNPTITHKYHENKLLSKSVAEVIIDDFIEITPYSRDTFYMPAPMRVHTPKANVFNFLICYYLSPFEYDKEVCQSITYKIDDKLIQKIN